MGGKHLMRVFWEQMSFLIFCGNMGWLWYSSGDKSLKKVFVVVVVVSLSQNKLIYLFISGRWNRLNVTKPCFGTKGNDSAKFIITKEGFLAAFKVVHTRGQVNCDKDACHGSFASKWGCSTSHPYVGTTPLGTFITTPSRRILFPREKFIRNKSMSKWYALPGFEPDSPFLVFHDFANPEFVQYGQQVEIWYGEDLDDVSEGDNDGESCVEVLAWYL